MLVREAVARIQAIYNRGPKSDDSRLSNRHAYSVIKTVRSKLMRQRLNKRHIVSDWDVQTISCAKLIKVPKNDCGCIPNTPCDNIRRVEFPIPKPIITKTSAMLKYVTDAYNNISFDASNWDEQRYKHHSKYASKRPNYYIRDNYLYITHRNNLEYLTFSGIFEDPVAVELLDSTCSCNPNETIDCVSALDIDIHIDGDLAQTLIEMSYRELVELLHSIPQDYENDNQERQTV